MPIYQFLCPECGVYEESLRSVMECTLPLGCFNCGTDMMRIYSAPAVLNRSKPGTFRHEPGKLDANDDRLAHLRNLELTKRPDEMRRVRKEVGDRIWSEVIQHKKEKYG